MPRAEQSLEHPAQGTEPDSPLPAGIGVERRPQLLGSRLERSSRPEATDWRMSRHLTGSIHLLDGDRLVTWPSKPGASGRT